MSNTLQDGSNIGNPTQPLLHERGEMVEKTMLPTFGGDLSHWNKDIDALNNTFAHPEGLEFEAQLPEIIGYISPEESSLMSKLPDGSEVSISDQEGTYGMEYLRQLLPPDWPEEAKGLQIMFKLFPDLMSKIEEDIQIVTAGKGVLRFAEIEKYRTAAGEIAKGTGHLHTDDMVGDDNDVTNTHYLIANGQPTVFYRGKAKLFRLPNGRIRLDTDSLVAPDDNTEAAPVFAIVRTNGATVHRSPTFDEDFSRVWMRISAGLATDKA